MFREKLLDSTPSAAIVECPSGVTEDMELYADKKLSIILLLFMS